MTGASVVVLGVGHAGRVAARVLADRGADVLASDAGPIDDAVAAELRAAGVEVEQGGHEHALDRLERADVVLPSPGIPPHQEVVARAIASGCPITSELELAARMTDGVIVGVTGTNGKTTVVRMIEAALGASGVAAVACGNNEVPFLQAAHERPDAEVFVVEASSFRLAFCHSFRPRVAVFTNIAPDHQDWHGSMDDYLACKARLVAHQGEGNRYLRPGDEPRLTALDPGRATAVSIGDIGDGPRVWTVGDDVKADLGTGVVTVPDAVTGRATPHLRMDAAAAAGAALVLGAAPDAVGRALRGFEVEPHRMQDVGQRDGVRFIDDSKATNAHATVAAVASLERVVLIAGGMNRSRDLDALAAVRDRLRAVIAFGASAEEIRRVFEPTGTFVPIAATLDEAVGMAIDAATSGDVVLLSPACASFDAFASYAERGRRFQDACHAAGVRP